MSKRVVLIGHCGPDSSYLRMSVSRVDRNLKVVMADDAQELEQALADGADLLLFNRLLDYGFEETEGVALIAKLHARYPNVKMMLVSNYPDAQGEAIAAGALPGFGKRELGTERVTKLIREALLETATPKDE